MRFLKLLQFVLVHFYKDQCLVRASALAFTTLLALVPLLIVIFSILAAFPVFNHVSAQLQHFVFQNFVPSSGAVIENYISRFQQDAHELPIFSFLFLLVTAWLLLADMESHLNAVLRIKKNKDKEEFITPKRHLILSLLTHWGILICGPVFICASVFLSSYLNYFDWLNLKAERWIYLLPFLCTFLAFIFLYLVIPAFRVNVIDAFWGGLTGSLLFELSKYGFKLYLHYFPTYSILYGALSVIPVFLVWIYIAWSIFLLGAEVIKARAYYRWEKSERSMP